MISFYDHDVQWNYSIIREVALLTYKFYVTSPYILHDITWKDNFFNFFKIRIVPVIKSIPNVYNLWPVYL